MSFTYIRDIIYLLLHMLEHYHVRNQLKAHL